jgi:hypothetical protein
MANKTTPRKLSIVAILVGGILANLPTMPVQAESKAPLRPCKRSERRISLDQAYEQLLPIVTRVSGRERYQLASDMQTLLALSDVLQRGECLISPNPGMSQNALTKYMKPPLSAAAMATIPLLNTAHLAFRSLDIGAETVCSTLSQTNLRADPLFEGRTDIQVYCCRVQFCSDTASLRAPAPNAQAD